MLRASLVVLALWVAAPAAAQDADPDAQALADANYLRDVGAGLTLGGLATTTLGVGLMFGVTGFENYSGAIAGGTFEGIGGVLSLVGIPMWIVGGIRSDVLSRPLADRPGAARTYELAGLGVTLTCIAISLAGGALLAAGFAGESSWPRDERTLEALRGWGAALIPIGWFIATWIGAPLWAEGARF